MAGNNSVVGLETITFTDNMSFDGTERGGAMTTNGQLWIGSTPARHVRLGNLSSSDNSITITNGPGTIDLKSNPAVVPDLHTAKWIVNNVPNSGGNQTTIAAAIAAASPGDTIFIMPGSTGVYTENLTLPANINLVAFTGDGDTPHVTIKGKVTMTVAGQSTISNIRLETNGDFCIDVTGSANTVLELINCYINATNNTAISYTSSGASSGISMVDSALVVSSGAAFVSSGAGAIAFYRCNILQTIATTTASTISAGFVLFNFCSCSLVNITTSGTANFQSFYSHFIPSNTTGPALTHGGTGTESYVLFSDFQNNNTAGPVISISAGATLKCGQITATNFNGGVASISGAGTINYSEIGSLIATNTVTVTTQNKNPIDTGLVRSVNGITFDGGTNTLSNYVAPTSWTPVLSFGGSSTGITYTTQIGRYIRVGSSIHFSFDIVLSSKGAQVGLAGIAGLPFTSNAISQDFICGIQALTTTGTYITCTMSASSNSFLVVQWVATTGAVSALTNTAFANNTEIRCTGVLMI